MTNIFSLKGKIALVTGATGYLGRILSEGLAIAGARVYINGRTCGAVDDLVDSLKSKGYDVKPAVFDVTDSKQIKDFFFNFNESRINILINNAYSGKLGSTNTATVRDFRDSYEISLVASHDLFQNSLPYFRKAKQESGDASIINIASMYGMVSPDVRMYDSEKVANPPFYGAAKAALIQWTKYTACEFAKEGIRVNAISPGAFPPSKVKEINPEFFNKMEKKAPMERVGSPEELIGSVVFLSSGASSYVTGINLPVDGGWTAL